MAGDSDSYRAEGVYRFPSLPPGMYELEANLAGFQKVLQQNVRVGLGKNIEVNLQLGNLAVEEEIIVVAESAQVNTVSNPADFNIAEVSSNASRFHGIPPT